MTRALSYTEISTAQTCFRRWDYAYGGHSTGGDTLRVRGIAPRLSQGRAWGAAVAAWHGFSRDGSLYSHWHPGLARIAAHGALRASWEQDVATQLKAGVYISVEEQVVGLERLGAILDHHMATAEWLPNLTKIEDEIDVPIPSRGGKRASTKYRFHGFLDGFTVDEHENDWIAEFKLRDNLTDPSLIELSQQIKWYAWSRQRETGRPVIGCIIDERVNDAPKPPRIVQEARKGEGIDGYTVSHAKNQLTTLDEYLEACALYGVDPKPTTVDALSERVWQQRIPILFRPGELAEAGEDLVTAGKLIRDLDHGDLTPVRNSQPFLCRGCKFKRICANPTDHLFVDTLFERTVPKRLRDIAERVNPNAEPEPDRVELISTNPFDNVHREEVPVGEL